MDRHILNDSTRSPFCGMRLDSRPMSFRLQEAVEDTLSSADCCLGALNITGLLQSMLLWSLAL